jgi:hypothetical protein
MEWAVLHAKRLEFEQRRAEIVAFGKIGCTCGQYYRVIHDNPRGALFRFEREAFLLQQEAKEVEVCIVYLDWALWHARALDREQRRAEIVAFGKLACTCRHFYKYKKEDNVQSYF